MLGGTENTEYAALGDNICSVLAFAGFICLCISMSLWHEEGIMERWDKEVAKKRRLKRNKRKESKRKIKNKRKKRQVIYG